MGTFIIVVVILILIAIIVVQPLLVLFSRRYPRKQMNLERREPPAR